MPRTRTIALLLASAGLAACTGCAQQTIEPQAESILRAMGETLGAVLPVQFRPYKKVTQKTDIYVSASPTGAAVDISAGFDLIVVDN